MKIKDNALKTHFFGENEFLNRKMSVRTRILFTHETDLRTKFPHFNADLFIKILLLHLQFYCSQIEQGIENLKFLAKIFRFEKHFLNSQIFLYRGDLLDFHYISHFPSEKRFVIDFDEAASKVFTEIFFFF